MPRRSHSQEKRRELLPIVARAFADLGYRRTTTAELAQRCGVRENTLYRLWPDKKTMFIAAIGYVCDLSVEIWGRLLAAEPDGRSGAERLLAYEAAHHGEFGLYRIVFAGLSETDDPDIRSALAQMYQRFLRFVQGQIMAHRAGRHRAPLPEAGLAAWAVVGLGTLASISRELELLSEPARRRLMTDIGRFLLSGAAA